MNDAEIKQLATEYAERFDADNGDTLQEYAERAAGDVYPFTYGVTKNGNRKDFAAMIISAVQEKSKIRP